jgi:hypothetical protein
MVTTVLVDPPGAGTVSEPAAGVMENAAAPVPLNATTCGEKGLLPLTFRFAVSEVVLLGVKVTVVVHWPPAGRLPMQLLVWEKSLALAPDIVIPLMVTGTVAGLLICNFNEEGTLTPTAPKLKFVEDRPSGGTPTPLRIIIWLDERASSLMTSFAASAAGLFAVNVTVAVHWPPMGMLAVQLPAKEKSATFAPERLRVVMFSGEVPVFMIRNGNETLRPTPTRPKFKLDAEKPMPLSTSRIRLLAASAM